ncbi:hypothetical protein D3C87_1453560 [compost metagenome]
MTLQTDRSPFTGLDGLPLPVTQCECLGLTGLDCLEVGLQGDASLFRTDIAEYPKILRYVPFALFENILTGKQ